MEPVQLSPSSTESSVENVQPGAGIGEQYKECKPLYERFGAKEGLERTDKAFAAIWEYAKEHAELKDKDSVLWEIRKLEMKLGSPSYGQKPWLNLISYVSTHNQMRSAEERLKAMEANH